MINERIQAIGSWDLELSPETPQEILKKLEEFGHIVILPQRIDPRLMSDAGILAIARYTGILRGKSFTDHQKISGVGLLAWLGDEDDKGNIFETEKSYSGASFATVIADLLTGSGIQSGTLNSVAGTFTGRFIYVSPRKAIEYVTDAFNAEYKIRPDGRLDAGTEAQLYTTTPKGVIMRKYGGQDPELKPIPVADLELGQDMKDYTTKVILLPEGHGEEAITPVAASLPSVPYKDLFGGTVVRKRLISESETSDSNAATRAQLHLNRFSAKKESLQLSTADYDIEGDFGVGDYVWVYDVESGLFNLANEVRFRGMVIHPVKIRVLGVNSPITKDSGVYYRDKDGVYIDLSQWYLPQGGATSLEVGNFVRTRDSGEAVGPRLQDIPGAGEDTTIPAVPTKQALPWTRENYLDSEGRTKSRILVQWAQPLNTDNSTVTDGSHYVVRYRKVIA